MRSLIEAARHISLLPAAEKTAAAAPRGAGYNPNSQFVAYQQWLERVREGENRTQAADAGFVEGSTRPDINYYHIWTHNPRFSSLARLNAA